MLTMGDEVRRTQLGNNNAYCQDSELSWFDWGARRARTRACCASRSGLIAGRRAAQALFDVPSDVTLAELLARLAGRAGTGRGSGEPDTSDASRSIALAHLGASTSTLHLILNAYWEALDFAVPPAEGGMDAWQRIVDTTWPARTTSSRGGRRAARRGRHLPRPARDRWSCWRLATPDAAAAAGR